MSGGGWCNTHVVLISNILFLQHIRQVGMERQKRHVLAPFDRDTRIAVNVSEHGGIDVALKQVDKTILSQSRCTDISMTPRVTTTEHCHSRYDGRAMENKF